MRKILAYIFLLCAISCSSGTGSKNSNSAPIKLPSQGGARSNRSDIRIPFEERGNVKIITVKLNGMSMDMIFDTGASGVHLSLHELQTLAKNGQFSDADCIGTSLSQIADGSIVENGLIILRSVMIGGENGIEVTDVEATVALNQDAPLLLGNNVLDEFASYTIDNESKNIIFKKK